MGVLVVAFFATLIGFVLILWMGKNTPVHPAAMVSGAGTGELDWVRGFGIEGFQRLVILLFAEMGFAVEKSDRSSETVDVLAVDSTPIRGARVSIHGLWSPPLGIVGADEVRSMLDASRAEFVGKGILLTLGGFSEDARAEARGTPVDLIDGEALAKLVKKVLPQVYAQKKI